MNVRSTLFSFVPALALLVPAGLSAQDHLNCGLAEARRQLAANDPKVAQQQAEYEHGLRAYIEHRDGLREDGYDDSTVYVIPLVFHILHDPENDPNDNDNISDEQIYNQVNILNRDYRKLNADANDAVANFGEIVADCKIEFRLATKDPYGNCTNGIDRVSTLRTNGAADWSKVNTWMRDRYLNVWVVRSIGSEGTAGYAFYPTDVSGNGLGALRDGVLILYDYIGSIEQGTPGRSRALTHEIGHYLNLVHPWGSTNDPGVACGDDGVSDTPITKGWDFCPTPAIADVCTDGIVENYQNYMDYSYCSIMFTDSQAVRMRNALNNPETTRPNLWTESNHIYTGIEGYEYTCGPEADFYSLERMRCVGDQFHFRDNSRRATPTTWAWTFDGGNPSTSNERDPVVTFDTDGWHEVTLTVGNEYGSSTKTSIDQAIVSPGWSEVNGLLNESFPDEAASNLWPHFNFEENFTDWRFRNDVGHYGNGCMWLNASATYVLQVDQLSTDESGLSDKDVIFTPSMDLRNVSGMQFSFWYAYASRTSVVSQIQESLRIYSSTDCGHTWLPRKTIDGAELVTAGVAAGGYLPGPQDWRQVTFTVPSTVAREHVRFKFEYNSARFSNDIFLDDVNINGTVGISEMEGSGNIELMPNPATDQLTMTLDMAGSNKGSLTILDMTGRAVYTQAVTANQKRIDLDLGAMNVTDGLYLVQLKHEKGQRTERLVVQ